MAANEKDLAVLGQAYGLPPHDVVFVLRFLELLSLKSLGVAGVHLSATPALAEAAFAFIKELAELRARGLVITDEDREPSDTTDWIRFFGDDEVGGGAEMADGTLRDVVRAIAQRARVSQLGSGASDA